MLHKDGRWVPICGHYFWDNNHGATLFCQKMNYDEGTVVKTPAALSLDAFRIGKCEASDKRLLACTGGCNDLKVGGVCSGFWGGDCSAGNAAVVKVRCRGSSTKHISCVDK